MSDKELTERQVFDSLNAWEQKLRNGKKSILTLTDADQVLISNQWRHVVADIATRIAVEIDTLYEIIVGLRNCVYDDMVSDPFYSEDDED